jgi:hypothetical protein
MRQHNLYWTQWEVSFGVWEQEECKGLLRIIPLGCEVGEQRANPDAPPHSTYGVYVQVKIEQDEFKCTGFDFIHPGCFRDLHHMLKKLGNPAPAEAKLIGAEGGIEIDFHWREDGDVSVEGHVPARINPWDSYLARDPLLLRKCIKTLVDFEFLLQPEKIPESCDEIERLLEHIRSVEESYSPSFP